MKTSQIRVLPTLAWPWSMTSFMNDPQTISGFFACLRKDAYFLLSWIKPHGGPSQGFKSRPYVMYQKRYLIYDPIFLVIGTQSLEKSKLSENSWLGLTSELGVKNKMYEGNTNLGSILLHSNILSLSRKSECKFLKNLYIFWKLTKFQRN